MAPIGKYGRFSIKKCKDIDDNVKDNCSLRRLLVLRSLGEGLAVLRSFTYLRFLPYFFQWNIWRTLILARGLWGNALVAWLYHVKIVGAFSCIDPLEQCANRRQKKV